MGRKIYVSRRYGRNRVGMWVPANLIAVGYLFFLILALIGVFQWASRDPSKLAEEQIKWLKCAEAHKYKYTNDCGVRPFGIN